MKALNRVPGFIRLRLIVSCLAQFAIKKMADVLFGMRFQVERGCPRRTGLASVLGKLFRPVTVVLAVSIAGCGIAPVTLDAEPSDLHEDRFELILFEYTDSPDVSVSEFGTQPGLEEMKDHEAIRVLTEQNLIDADWKNRTLTFDESVYAEQTSEAPVLSVSRVFVIVFDDQPLIGGMVINQFFAPLVDMPVMRPHTYLHDNGLIVTLEQNNSGRSGYPVELPALSNEVNAAIQDYLENVLRSP